MDPKLEDRAAPLRPLGRLHRARMARGCARCMAEVASSRSRRRSRAGASICGSAWTPARATPSGAAP
eukprot:3678298-Alexandrium_andersonii.AAC.1